MAVATVMDQVRTAVRFPMKLRLRLMTSEGAIDAETENVSANGILFTAARLPAVSSTIEFTMLMPGAVMGHDGDVLYECVGRVVRHQADGEKRQAAAIIDNYVVRS